MFCSLSAAQSMKKRIFVIQEKAEKVVYELLPLIFACTLTCMCVTSNMCILEMRVVISYNYDYIMLSKNGLGFDLSY